ncbi:hypothetical protein [Streptomyces sp. STR69]|uniref:hypothetical protein n=1 Tax=Streptomyces sp. STR69 TaxID=1796942 RepID=UPI0021C70843|nr:hypothetical protein [Streptomyces sp. STR69]
MSTDDLNRVYTRRLSELLSGENGTLALALLQKLGTAHPAEPPAPVPAAATAPDTVGVWRRTEQEYVRDPARRDQWRYWADLDRLPLAPGRRRTVVLGESAARGYFYDPAFSFASVLGGMLTPVAGLADVDVLDLARTNANFGDLEQVLEEAAGLRPDALVVYAGNNWNNIDPTPHQLQRLAEALREGGYPAAGRLFQDFVVERSGRFLDLLAATAAGCGAPVTLVVPEFNLADWEDERSLVCPALPGDAGARWLRLRARTLDALEAGRHEEALGLAHELTRLDGGTSPVSGRLLARAAAANGDETTREQALVTAKDAAVGLFTLHSPRILAVVQAEMRRKAQEHGFHLVDLPRLFRAADDGALPGRRFHLDYCHLSFGGLALAAAAAASATATALGSPAPAAADLVRAASGPTPAQAAAAHLLAAVHNAHYGQPAELLRHHLDRALELDPGIAPRIEDYLDYQTRTAPHWMCASYERSAVLPQFARYLVAGDTRLTGKLADHTLREGMVEALAAAGVDVRESYEKLLIAEQAGDTVDLLADQAQATTFGERLGASTGSGAAYLLARDLTSEFHLVVDDPADTVLTLAWRLPRPRTAEAAVTLTVNGKPCFEQPLGDTWTKHSLTVPAGLLRRGRNVLSIAWPLPDTAGDEEIAAGAAALERGALPQSLPARGHVFAFTAHKAPVRRAS